MLPSTINQARITGKNSAFPSRTINRVPEDQVVVSSHDVHCCTSIDETLLISYYDRVEEDLHDEFFKGLVVFRQKFCNPVVGSYRKKAAGGFYKRLDVLTMYLVLVELSTLISACRYEHANGN